eukprot:15296737-Heterocapsa_arctica.AAC.1
MPRRHHPRRPWKTAGAGRGGSGGRSPRMGQANVFTPTAVAGLEGVWRQEVTRKDPNGNPDKGRGKHARGPVAV